MTTLTKFIFTFSQISNSSRSDNNNSIISQFNWVLIPVLNPDGYVYTWMEPSTRMWRKNRSFTREQMIISKEKDDDLCIGVDINRNFDSHWGGKFFCCRCLATTGISLHLKLT